MRAKLAFVFIVLSSTFQVSGWDDKASPLNGEIFTIKELSSFDFRGVKIRVESISSGYISVYVYNPPSDRDLILQPLSENRQPLPYTVCSKRVSYYDCSYSGTIYYLLATFE